MTEKRLYLDMDGTLARFRKVETIEELLQRGYFLNLEPNMNIIEAVKDLIRGSFFDGIYILSAVPRKSMFAREEKVRWLKKYLPEIKEDHMLFPFCDKPKAFSVAEDGRVPATYYLLDDNNRNLNDWSSFGGSSVKFAGFAADGLSDWNGKVVRNTSKCLEELFFATV